MLIIGNYEKKSRIDNLFIYRKYCIGCEKSYFFGTNTSEDAKTSEKQCEESDAIYLFYRSKGENYIEKRNECHKYKPIQMDTLKAFLFFLNNFNDLKNDSIYPFGVREKGKKYYNIYQNHTLYYDIYLSNGNQVKVTSWSGFDFTDSTILGYTNDRYAVKNVNYERNLSSITNKLIDLIYRVINGIIFIRN